jgi:hypothetical protein
MKQGELVRYNKEFEDFYLTIPSYSRSGFGKDNARMVYLEACKARQKELDEAIELLQNRSRYSYEGRILEFLAKVKKE